MPSQSALPENFGSLEPWAATWGRLNTPGERYLQRQSSSMEDLRGFHAAAAPRLEDIFRRLDATPYPDLPPAEANLFRTALGLAEVMQAVEVYGRARVGYAPYPHRLETVWIDLPEGAARPAASQAPPRPQRPLHNYNAAATEEFDIGFGPTMPDPAVMQSGLVRADTYTSQERFAIERTIFRNAWLQVARIEEAPANGDWLVREIEVCDASVIVVNDGERLRAFHNVCAHRGMRLLWEERGNSKLFVCPYHAWSYSTAGRAAAIPDATAFPQLRLETVGLREISVDQWAGFIFINLNPQPATTLREFLGPVADMLQDLPFDRFTCYARVSETINANWKLGVDAGAEGYHISVLHAKSARPWVCTAQNPHTHYLGWEPLGAHRVAPFPTNTGFALTPEKPVQKFAFSHMPQTAISGTGEASGRSRIGFGDHPDLNRSRAADWGGDQLFLFPVGALNFTLNGFYHNCYWPITPDTSRWSAQWYFPAPKSYRDKFALECSMAMNRDIVTEDNFAIQGQHKGLKAGAMPEVAFGEGEMLPRHMAAVIEGQARRLAALGLAPV